MTKQLIEMVCTGNRGRSPVAEMLARQYLEEVDAFDEYDVISSGTIVEAAERGGFPISVMKRFTDQAIGRGDIYTNADLERLEEALDREDQPAVETLYNKVIEQFVREEEEDRAIVLPELGIVGEVKKTQEQTTARGDTAAVFSVDKRNNGIVSGLYEAARKTAEGEDYNPTIAVLSAYANRDPNAEVTNAFGKGRDVYREAIQQLIRDVPVAVQRVLVES